ncbi:hypothetical protein ACUN24_22170 [Pedobacter sp. WC2501]|uniref:hypothetical protein n=1 Tax=Pedobacter sp. WC2501 TaxID=3461400 RepID=UPI00404662B1
MDRNICAVKQIGYRVTFLGFGLMPQPVGVTLNVIKLMDKLQKDVTMRDNLLDKNQYE